MKYSALIFISLGWMMDVLSTFVGMQLGFMESSQLFSQAPFMWLIIMVLFAFVVQNFKWAPRSVRGALLLAMVLYSFVPALRNLAVIWGVGS